MTIFNKSKDRFSKEELNEIEGFENEYFNPEDLCGSWYCKLDIFPSILIYKDHALYKVAILHTSLTGQVQPEICILDNFMISCSLGVVRLSLSDNLTLMLSGMGEYRKIS
mgnify:CR=1 FL=1